jgi:hypothetical protein
MDDPQITPEPNSPKESVDPGAQSEINLPSEPASADVSRPEAVEDRWTTSADIVFAEKNPHAVIPGEVRNLSGLAGQEKSDSSAPVLAWEDGVFVGTVAAREDVALRRRNFRHNLLLLLSLTLAAFILTAWILVRVDAPFGIFSTGPQEIVRAQLRALDRGELRPAYDMFSPRYRGQVSFDTWHELFVRHWRMFHADVVRADTPPQSGPGVTLEIYLHGADDKDYRARFTLIRTDGRWWIDDVHWMEEADERDVSRT